MDVLAISLIILIYMQGRTYFFISRQLKNSESRYGASHLECLCLVWALDKLYYYLDGCQFELITDCTYLKSLLSMKTPNRHMLMADCYSGI